MTAPYLRLRSFVARHLVASVCLFGLLAALLPLRGARAEAAPVLTLEPARGRCDERNPLIIARGANFPPGVPITFAIGRGRDYPITP